MWHGGKTVQLVTISVLLFAGTLFADAQVDRVGQALNDLHQWLGDDENARHWKEFLHSDELVQQLAKGNAADRAKLGEILNIYSGNEPGLEKRRFVAVRQALEQWITQVPVAMADLPALVKAEKDRFHAASPESVDAAKSELAAAMSGLERFLATGREENAQNWKEYLKWSATQAELERAEGPRPAELERIAALYSANHTGLEVPAFSKVRSALYRYARALYYSGDAAKQAHAQRIDDLIKRLEESGKDVTTENTAMIGRTLGWLERGNQAPAVVTAVRSNFNRPNLYASASQRLVAARFETAEARERLNRPQGFSDVIVGTPISGTAYPRLSLHALLVPNSEQAEINLHMTGNILSSNVGRKGPVTIYSSGYTSVNAGKHIYINEHGMSSSRAGAAAATSTSINRISTRCRLIEKLAWQQANKVQGQAEAEASSHARWRIAGQLDREVDAQLAESNANYAENFRNRLERKDNFPSLHLSSTASALNVEMRHAAANQLATNSEPPALTGEHDLAVRLHESLVVNMGESILGGETLTDEKLVKMLEDADAEIPDEIRITPDKDPWSITFTDEQPVSMTFSGDQITFAIRGRRFTRADQEVRAVMEISAVYKLEKSGTGSKMTRQGDLKVDYVNNERLSIGEVAMKTFIRKKFESLFKPERTSDGLKLPKGFEGIGKLHLQQMSADKGWLTLGWEKPSTAETVAIAEYLGLIAGL